MLLRCAACEAVPLPCVSTALLAKTVPFLAFVAVQDDRRPEHSSLCSNQRDDVQVVYTVLIISLVLSRMIGDPNMGKSTLINACFGRVMVSAPAPPVLFTIVVFAHAANQQLSA